MTRRKDNKPGSQTSQDALQDYLQNMLSDPAAGLVVPAADAVQPESTTAVASVDKSSQPEKSRLQKKKPSEKNRSKKSKRPTDTVEAVGKSAPLPQRTAAKTKTRENIDDQFAAADDHSRTVDLQQKLLQARVKDLAEKSVQAAKEQREQQLQQAQRDAERRERMDAARALVKQRIAARSISHVAADNAAEAVHEAEPPAAAMAPETPSEQQPQKPPPWLENGRPVWAQGAFECLLFSVSGLTLAVPLVELGSIYPIKDHLTPIIGQIDWFMGLLHVHNRNHIRTVNTAKIVMPEKYDASFVDQIRYVISINGYDWGLAVDNVDKAITLRPADVRWRTERSKRSWLAGTVVDYMCALVDVQELAVMLSSADHSKPRSRH